MPVATPPPVAHAAVATRLDRAIVREINAVRGRAGLSRVVATLRLHRLARHHTLDMLRRDSFSHDGDGTTFSQRIKARVHYRKVGETLASMPRRASARRIVRAWMHSPPHRAVILDPAYRRIGVSGKGGQLGAHHAFLVTADFSTWR
jgi:uncharacterized protein YkwD